MVCVAGRGHGQAADLCVLEGVTVIAAKSCRGVEHFDRIDSQRFQSGKTDPSAKQIIRMRRNGEPAALVDHVADLARRLSLQVRQLGTDTKQVPVGGSHFDSGQNETIIYRQSVQSHQAFLEQVIDRIACVVISDCNAMQTFGARRCDHVFRTGDTVPGKKRVRVQVDVKCHCLKGRNKELRIKWLKGGRYTSSSTAKTDS